MTHDVTRDMLVRGAKILGPSSSFAKALADVKQIEAEGDRARCVLRGSLLLVLREPKE